MLHLNRGRRRAGGFGGGFGGFDFGGDMGDIFGDIFGDILAAAGPGGPEADHHGRQHKDFYWITFEEAVCGCEKRSRLILKKTCASCHGTGAKGRHFPSDLFQV